MRYDMSLLARRTGQHSSRTLRITQLMSLESLLTFNSLGAHSFFWQPALAPSGKCLVVLPSALLLCEQTPEIKVQTMEASKLCLIRRYSSYKLAHIG